MYRTSNEVKRMSRARWMGTIRKIVESFTRRSESREGWVSVETTRRVVVLTWCPIQSSMPVLEPVQTKDLEP